MLLPFPCAGVSVPEGYVDQHATRCDPHQSARRRQGLVQPARDQLGGLPDVQDEEVYGDGQV